MGNSGATTSSSSSSSSVHYCGGEDWNFLVTSSGNNNRNHKSSTNKVFDESKLTNNKLHDHLEDLTASSTSRNGKIKIKMTKKELQVLLRELEKQKRNKKKKNSAEQVLVRLMEARLHRTGHNNWNPVLESIPEAYTSSD